MQNTLLILFPILLLVLTFYCATFSQKGLISDTFLNLDQSKNIQASICLAIILHHLTQQITVYGMRPKGPITLFSHIGYLFTALFFFFSGYGLMTSLKSKPDYLDTFLKRRLPAVIIPFWIINILGVILTCILPGPKLRPSEIAGYVVGLTLINGNGWFIIEIVILYLAFYLLFKLIKNRNIATALLCLFTLLLMIYSFLQGHDAQGAKTHWFRGEWWYDSTITFAFGILFAGFKDRFADFCVKHYSLMIALFAVLNVIAIRASIYAQTHLGYYHEPVHHGARDAIITLVIQSVSCIIFTTFILILNMRLSIGNKGLSFIRRMSLELFLIHGFVQEQIFGRREMSDLLRFVAVISFSILCGALVSPVVKLVVKKLTALLCTRRVKNSTLEQAIKEKQHARRLRMLAFAAMITVIAGLLYFAVIKPQAAKSQYVKECSELEAASVGDIVKWGQYEINPSIPGKEPITWIILEKGDNSALLVSEMGLGGSYYNQHYTEVSWENSDLRKLINSAECTGSFNKYELENMLTIDGDLISLLSVDEAERLFSSDPERELLITPAAKVRGTNINDMSKHHEWDMVEVKTSWWWLRGDKGVSSITAPIVTVDGVISVDEKYVNKPGGAIRPVIRVKF